MITLSLDTQNIKDTPQRHIKKRSKNSDAVRSTEEASEGLRNTCNPNISRVRDAYLLRYQGVAVVYYGCTLECLANIHLEHVKYPG